jgi:hypothetical protein
VHLHIGAKGVRFVPIFEKSGNFLGEIGGNAKNLKRSGGLGKAIFIGYGFGDEKRR